MMLLWLFDVCLDGLIRERKAKLGNGVQKWSLAVKYDDDTVLFVENEEDLQKVVSVL